MNPVDPRVGLALSGGGFRAAAFHLGALKRLEELGVLRRIRLLSTVSGGSITGALYALRCASHGDGSPGSYPVEDLIAEMRNLLSANLRGRAFFGSPRRIARTLTSFVVPQVRRMPLLADELNRTLFADARLTDLPSWIAINATSLRTGKGWMFYRDAMGDYLAGITTNTAHVRVADAVAASAAYPGLTDPYPLVVDWADLREASNDQRWQSLPAGARNRWRTRYGQPRGPGVFPLVDGGVYDNEGITSLRGAVSHAIISSAAPPEADTRSQSGLLAFQRTIDVMHSRLGALGRQFLLEATHAVHPTKARGSLLQIAQELQELTRITGIPDLAEIGERLRMIAQVGWPLRQAQFSASAQILLHHTTLATNNSALWPEQPLDVHVDDRGLSVALVDELSRVRTDLDAHTAEVIDLLIAQGYFLTDAKMKIGMPDLVAQGTGVVDTRSAVLRPTWDWARAVIHTANSHQVHAQRVLQEAQARKILGRRGR